MLNNFDNQDQKSLVREEQAILDALIRKIDQEILKTHRSMSYAQLQKKKAKEQNLSDTYGMLLNANYYDEIMKENEALLYKVRDELYDTRIVVDLKDEKGRPEEEEIKIGLHGLNVGGKVYVCTWTLPLCRHYLMDDPSQDFHAVVKDKYELYETDYHLKMKRKVTIRFDKVKKVAHLFPLTEEEEHIVSDEFLQTLREHRSEENFQNIVFSIQKKQGAIIQRPYSENMIVQGCAGSGKSMIMLHRLPILLYDNPNLLARNSIYIITPSRAYIQLAEEMRAQLEISDLQMGTLEEYYDYELQKYGFDPTIYGRSRSSVPMTQDQEKYVYSNRCVQDIRQEINDLFIAGYYDPTHALGFFNLNEKIANGNPRDIIRQVVIVTTHIIQANYERLQRYEDLFKAVGDGFRDLHNMLQGRQLAVTQSIRRRFQSVSQDIRKRTQEISRLDPQKNVSAIKNRTQFLNNLQDQAAKYNEDLYEALSDDEYFGKLSSIDAKLTAALQGFGGLNKDISNDDWKSIYSYIQDRSRVQEIYDGIAEELNGIEEKYLNYTDSMMIPLQSLNREVHQLMNLNVTFLSQEEFQNIINCEKYFEDLSKNLPVKVYTSILKRMGRKVITTKDGDLGAVAMDCSPYLFTRIVYMSQGAPGVRKENLITIDEAQNIAPVELSLLKHLNNEDVIFNLFGDVNQHIENTKGVDKWSDFDNTAHFTTYELNENYRNAQQITKYCNDYFDMDMLAINLPGRGVHNSIADQEDLDGIIKKILTGASHPGIKAVIVKSGDESGWIMNQYKQYSGYLNDMVTGNTAIAPNAWNVMTVKQAKGLEFNTVLVLAGNMTRNERYIAYTRALDELYIYEKPLQIEDDSSAASDMADPKDNEPTAVRSSERAKVSKTAGRRQEDRIQHNMPVKAANQTVAEQGGKDPLQGSPLRVLFVQNGLEVKDQRKEGGYLWVVGTRQELAPYIKEAGKKFGVTGKFMPTAKAIGNRSGWYTKSDK